MMRDGRVKPKKPSLKGNRRPVDDYDDREPVTKRKKKSELTDEERERILEMVDNEPETEALDDTGVKKLILQFEKRVYRNQEMRIKYPDMPEKFMESELELNDILAEMHVISTVPDLYQILVDMNAVQSLLQLLSHENSDVSIAVVDLLQEMTDVDTLTESEDGASVLFDALLDGQVVALLVQNMERLDESVKEESDGVYNTLGIIENMAELRSEVCQEAAQQGLMQWLLKRLKAKLPFDGNRLYTTEILAILLQNETENRKLLGELDGIDVLLQQLAAFKKHDPTSAEEVECMENMFNCLCSALMLASNRQLFLRGEGLQLMNLMLREKKLSRLSAIKVLDYAMTGQEGVDNCQKFVDILGLRSIFPLFMKTPKKHRKIGSTDQDLEEHVVSILGSMLRNCSGTQRQRLLNKFTESDHEKVDRLMELHFKYLSKLRVVDDRIEKEKHNLKIYGGDIDEETEEQFYLQRLEAGLFTLQLVDYIMLEICVSGPTSIKQRVTEISNMRGGSFKTIRGIMREYASNIGDAKDSEAQEAEQSRILELMEKF